VSDANNKAYHLKQAMAASPTVPGQGVVITEVQPRSKAAMAGLRPGMLIQEVNKIPVRSMKDFQDAIGQTGDKRSVLLLVRDQQSTRYVAIRMN